MAKRVVLAYSGGLDTSVAVQWMIEHYGVEVIACAADVGQEGGDLEAVRQRALAAGAVEAVVVAEGCEGASVAAMLSSLAGLRAASPQNNHQETSR